MQWLSDIRCEKVIICVYDWLYVLEERESNVAEENDSEMANELSKVSGKWRSLTVRSFWVSHCHNALGKYLEVAILELIWRWLWIKLYGQQLIETNAVQFDELVPYDINYLGYGQLINYLKTIHAIWTKSIKIFLNRAF